MLKDMQQNHEYSNEKHLHAYADKYSKLSIFLQIWLKCYD